MAFLFKSKKNHDRGPGSRDGIPGPGSASSTQSATARVRDEKGSRSTPTGSLNSLDNDGSVGSPEQQNYGRPRGQTLEGQHQHQQQAPSQMQSREPPQQPPNDLPFRNGANPNPMPMANPNASLYPWSQRRLTYTTSQPSPFPRYGAAVNSVSSKEGDIYVMGGLINSSMVRGDLWMIEAGGSMACYPLATTAEGPGPRVGHASLLVGNAFIVFGGDTKIDESDVLDETLYLLNTSTRQWSRALPGGPRPAGRYGHTLNILGSKIYVFGGQVEGYFMNDLAAFDLNQLQMPSNRWEMLIATTEPGTTPQGNVPPARTNHSMVTFNDKMYLFGGTNGFQWFNDVWCYDPSTNAWTMLECIGYIPVPREGHAAAIVDDVMYIFGGRTEEGADLGDLAAFRITSRRWYTFQNMGPSPSPRSGHSMTAVGKTVVVVGGEPSSATAAVNDLALVYCLDTTKIRYPPDSAGNPGAPRNAVRRPSNATPPSSSQNFPPRDGSSGPPDQRRLVGPPGDAGNTTPQNGFRGPPNPNDQIGPRGPPNGPPKPMRPGPPMGPAGPPPQGQPPRPGVNPAVARARNASSDSRADSYQGSPTQSPIVQQGPVFTQNESSGSVGRHTPTQNAPRSASSASRQTEPPAAETPKSKPLKQARTQGSVDSSTDANLKQAANRSASPPAPTARLNSNSINRRSSQRNSQTVVLLKELDAARNRNAWYASELELARKAGYVPTASMSPALDQRAAETFDDEDRPLIEALLAMRTELANVQNSVDKQAVLAAKQIAEAERQRDAAIQEAIYAKAKLAAQGGSARSTPQLDMDKDGNDRVGEMSRKLAQALSIQKDLQDQVDRLKIDLDAEKKARKLADDTASAAQKRMADLEHYKQKNSGEVEQLKAEMHMLQRQAREAEVAASEFESTAQMLRLEKDELENKYNEAVGNSKQSVETFQSLREAVAATTEMRETLERKLDEERALREEVEATLNKLKAEREVQAAELATITQRLRDAEERAERHANEARVHRQAVLAGLDKLPTMENRNLGNGEIDRTSALQGQLSAANALVRKYQQEADSASDKLRIAEERIAGLEAYQEQASREGVSIRRQLQSALRETQSLQAANSDLKQQLAKQQLETNAVLVQHNTLKDILTERGISPTSVNRHSRLGSPREGSPEAMRLRELEQQLAAAQAAHEETKASAAKQAQEAETTYRDKLAQLDNDYQSAVHYVKGTEKMLKQLKEQLTRYKTENSRLKEQIVELEDKVGGETGGTGAPADWETERESLQGQVSELQAELQRTASQLDQQLKSLREELEDVRQERDSAAHASDDASRRLEATKKDLEELQHENALLERRARDAEQKVSTLLDQVEMSVDNYRRRSRQVPNEAIGAAVTPVGPSNEIGHVRHESSEAESLYGPGPDARDSVALDHLTSELETLRSRWETNSKNYRHSNAFDFEGLGTPTASLPNQKSDGTLGLSESMADWRKKNFDDSHLDDDEHPPAGSAR
ncbi:hypothetical protein GE21DRAFT_2107 [Neurospora crassa]|uniref:Cell polarity protein n=1 Tax=Neurospora crassa (strain ATCC 24698 / 74-OR23-1A / CBS 708.71 / DSM 1257 / FGSC 987) TaxID=367110 RepID=Q7SI30_NEUCR|nr:cell polarity protein [Neurospora crassa OR74A]EAA36526.3 cell polarity protein [Neurospora crassa OR74A]KHE89845.1 hypothetical protein GE21DRAFT_2107 [Neurospora crassa]|eukprot:XP_965762.3 cell polarity protein [Neurospora crassa OR74A]